MENSSKSYGVGNSASIVNNPVDHEIRNQGQVDTIKLTTDGIEYLLYLIRHQDVSVGHIIDKMKNAAQHITTMDKQLLSQLFKDHKHE